MAKPTRRASASSTLLEGSGDTTGRALLKTSSGKTRVGADLLGAAGEATTRPILCRRAASRHQGCIEQPTKLNLLDLRERLTNLNQIAGVSKPPDCNVVVALLWLRLFPRDKGHQFFKRRLFQTKGC